MKRSIFLGILALAAGCWTASAEVVEVARGYDGKPFQYRIAPVEQQPLYTQYKITYDAPEPEPGVNPQGIAYYYLPAGITPGDAPRPGVICLHILGGDGSLTRMIASYLAQQGMPAMMVLMPWFGERAPAGGRSGMTGMVLAGALKQTPSDVRRAIDILQSRPEVNPDRLRLVGTSMGALFGATVTGMDERVKRAAFLLGGGDLPEILAQPTKEASPIREALVKAPAEKQPEVAAILTGIDPMTWAPALRGRAVSGNILMMNAANDEVIPPAVSRKLAEAMELPAEQLVWLPEVGHYTAISQLPDMLDRIAAYFTDATVRPPVAAQPQESLSQVMLTLLADTLMNQPGLKLALQVDGTLKNGKPLQGALLFRRGSEGRFLTDLDVTKAPLPLKKLTIGHDGSALWLGSNAAKTYRGSLSGEGTAPDFPQLDPRVPQYLTLGSGLLRMAAVNPAALRQFVAITEKTDDAGAEYLELFAPKQHLTILVYPDAARKYPARLVVTAEDFHGEIAVTAWELAAESDGAAFAPPESAGVIEVEAYDLHRMLNGTIAFFTQQ